MKRKWRVFVALSCAAALLITGPGLSVSASETQDAEIAAEAIVEEVAGSVSDEVQEQTIEMVCSINPYYPMVIRIPHIS